MLKAKVDNLLFSFSTFPPSALCRLKFPYHIHSTHASLSYLNGHPYPIMEIELHPAISLLEDTFNGLVAPPEMLVDAINSNLNLQRYKVLFMRHRLRTGMYRTSHRSFLMPSFALMAHARWRLISGVFGIWLNCRL